MSQSLLGTQNHVNLFHHPTMQILHNLSLHFVLFVTNLMTMTKPSPTTLCLPRKLKQVPLYARFFALKSKKAITFVPSKFNKLWLLQLPILLWLTVVQIHVCWEKNFIFSTKIPCRQWRSLVSMMSTGKKQAKIWVLAFVPLIYLPMRLYFFKLMKVW